MKKLNLIPVALAALAACGSAAAQTSVTLYGQVAAGVEYRNHQGAGVGGNQWLVNNNEFYVSNFGLRGSEDLGDGMKAIFRLESGMNTDVGTAGGPTGNTTSQNKFWNRQSFVGLDFGANGTLTVGRQFSALVDRAVRTMDPYNVGGNGLQTTPVALYGVNRYVPAAANFITNDNRSDDSVKYRVIVPAYGIDAGASMGYDDGEGAHYSFDVNHTNGKDYNIGAGYIQYKAPAALANGHVPKATTWIIGGNLTFGTVKLYANYMYNKLEQSAATNPLTAATAPAAIPLLAAQVDKIVTVGARWSVAPNMDLSGAFYADKGTGLGSNGAATAGFDGKKNTFVAAVDYYLSKRTLLNFGYFATKLSDGYLRDLWSATILSGYNTHLTGINGMGFSTYSGFQVGMRHSF
ncbi:porin [Burkholderiaceae bacterium UC74_6]